MKSYKERMLELRGELNLLNSQLDNHKKQQQDLKSKNEKLNQLISYSEKFINKIISDKKTFIEDFINDSLNYLLGKDSIKFEIFGEEKPSGMVWSYRITSGKIEGGIDTFGGGIMALISTLLRLALHILSNKESFIIFDESLNHLSSNYHHKVALLFRILAKKYNLSIVLITHQSGFLEGANRNLIFDKLNGELKLIREENK